MKYPLFYYILLLPPVNPHSASAYGKGIDRLLIQWCPFRYCTAEGIYLRMLNVCKMYANVVRDLGKLLSMRFSKFQKSSSPATSSIMKVEKTLINSMFSLFL